MAKKKGKKVGYGREAAEVTPGEWAWETPPLTWTWSPLPGINLVLGLPRGKSMGLVSAKTLQEAGLVAEGFHAGAQAGHNGLLKLYEAEGD